jgi:hypothetical protein
MNAHRAKAKKERSVAMVLVAFIDFVVVVASMLRERARLSLFQEGAPAWCERKKSLWVVFLDFFSTTWGRISLSVSLSVSLCLSSRIKRK